MKVFRMNDHDWVAAETREQAEQFYRHVEVDECDLTEEEFREEQEGQVPHELGSAAMTNLLFTDDDGKTKRTFQDQLDRLVEEKAEFPCIFASTEY